MVVGAEGTIVLPPALRHRRAWNSGTVIILTETPDGVLLVDRATALKTIRKDLGARPLVEELIAERRAAAAADREKRCADHGDQ